MARTSKLVLLLLAAWVLSWSASAESCSGCGCRGGPGYRGPDGRCVGAAQLRHICGDPPETKCKKEGGAGVVHEQCRGCGCKGGPGYREFATGDCVGHRDLDRKCGNPPDTRCRFEGAPSNSRS